jgi:prevent-host-death family protein
MRERHPTTQTMNVSDARQQFREVLDRVYRKETRVVVERSGIPVAAIVSTDDLQRLDRYDRERAARFAGLSRIGGAFADGPVEELERAVERAVAETRARARREVAEAAETR